MTIHQQHHIVENEGGFYCQTCADQAAIEAYLRSELTRAYEELEQARKDIVVLVSHLEIALREIFNEQAQ